MNAAGLAIGITEVRGGRHTPGWLFSLACRHILNTYTTTEQAVAFLEAIPYLKNMNFLVADAAGTIAMVETSPRRANVTYAENGFGVITNHFQSERMQPLESIKYRPPNSMQRWCRLQAWFNDRQEPITADHLKTIMGRPYPGGVWTVHKKSNRPVLGTVWSWVAALGERAIQWAEGSPDGKTPYQRIEF